MTDPVTLGARIVRGEQTLTPEIWGGFGDASPVQAGAGCTVLPGAGNAVLLDGPAGRILFDTGAAGDAERLVSALAALDGDPVGIIVLSGGDPQSAGGAAALSAALMAAGQPRPTIVARAGIGPRLADLAGGHGFIARNRTDTRADGGPMTLLHPDIGIEERMTLGSGDLACRLSGVGPAGYDQCWLWQPATRTACIGGLWRWGFPAVGQPFGPGRSPLDTAQALRAVADMEPEWLIPGYGPPVAGRQQIGTILRDVATVLEVLTLKARAMIDGGARLNDVLDQVPQIDEPLIAGLRDCAQQDRPWLSCFEGEPAFLLRAVWAMTAGWYDGNPAMVKPAPDRALAVELATQAGGAPALAFRARELADAGDLALACHLIEIAALAAPETASVHAARAHVYGRRRDAEPTLAARTVFADAATASARVAAALKEAAG